MNLSWEFRHAIRTLRKSPRFTIAATLTLALGIGANAAMFSVIRAVFLRPLPFPNENRLVSLWQSNAENGIDCAPVSPADFVDWEAQNEIFEHLGAWPESSYGVVAFNIVGNHQAEQVRGVYVSSGFFRALGVPPVLGRTFLPEEDRQRDHRSALVSHSFWQQRFGGDPSILGRTIDVDTFRGGVYTIVGVMPPGFDFPQGTSQGPQIFLPIAFWGGGPLPHTDAADRCCAWFSVVARLKPGVTLERARSEMTTIARRISGRHAQSARITGVGVTPLRREMIGNYRTGLLLLFGAVGLVLLIACVNVANLMLSRVLTRHGEMLIRSALGATTGHLARQVLAECLVLSGIGAVAGVFLAVWAQGLLARTMASQVPLAGGARIDWSVLAFSALMAAATACLCGLFPVTQLTAGRLRFLPRGTPKSYTPRAGLLRQVLVAAEVALAVALVAGAGLLIRSLAQLQLVDPGFRADQVLAVSFDLTTNVFRGPGKQQPFFHELMTRVAGLPGVEKVGAISDPPLTYRRMPDQAITLDGRPWRTAVDSPRVIARAVSPDYFAAMGIPLRKGRPFTESDSGDGRLVALINETAARLYWPGEDPVGKRMALGSRERFAYFKVPPQPGQPEWREIVGVVGDVRGSGLDSPPQPEVFYSYRQFPWYTPSLIVRSRSDPLQLAAVIRRQVSALSRSAVVTGTKTMEQVVGDSIAQPRFRAWLIGLFSLLALLLGMVGIFGVLSYTVEQRRREIGIRMALGATAPRVSWLVMSQALRATAIGLVAGVTGAFAVARVTSSLLYGITAADPATLAGTVVVFGAAALAASYSPARRAACVDPAAALRSE